MFKDYDYDITYHPQKANVVSDALSRKVTNKRKRARALSINVVSFIVGILKEAQIQAIKEKNKNEEKSGNYVVFKKNGEGLDTYLGHIWVTLEKC